MNRFVLLFQSDDRPGIVAKISDFIFRNNGNIVEADQYSTDFKNGHFFLRVEFVTDAEIEEISAGFSTEVASRFSKMCWWRFFDKSKKLRMGILVSSPDHCLHELLYLKSSGELNVDIPFVVSNCENHAPLLKCNNIPFYYVPASKNNRMEGEILELVKDRTDFLVLARYMLIFSGGFLKEYGKNIINIHHSFLPSFKGADPYGQAFERGVKVIGATAHFVAEELDEGPIISQVVEPVSHRDAPQKLASKGKLLEKKALAQALFSYCDYKIMRYKNRTIVF